jgi:cell division protein FtsL
MIRILNFTLILATGLICLGVYRVAEEARMSVIELRETRAAIAQEKKSMSVLGAEWAKMTQPARIQALAERYLNVTDRPAAQLASVSQLPPKFVPRPEDAIRNANAVVPQSGESQLSATAPASLRAQPAAPARTVLHTGT